jgi:hypothetical protein
MKASPGAGIAAGCQACHSEIAWGELSRFDHATAAFRLEGAHATVDCIKCHAPSATSSGLRVISYFISTSCESCHRDPHEGQFASRVKAMTAERSSGGCELCHGVKAWNQLTGFDHSTTSFPLVGAHKDAACEKCHQKEKRSDGSMQVKYVNSPRQCAGCHEDVHGGQFALAGKLMDCAKCHAAVKWAPSEFNHDAQSTYKLTGVHRNVRCVLCHSQRKEPTGKNAIIYRGTPRECSACHSGSEQEL